MRLLFALLSVSLILCACGTRPAPPTVVPTAIPTATVVPPTVTEAPPTATVKPATTPDPTVFHAWLGPSAKMPKTLAALPPYLETFLPPEAKGCVIISSPTPSEHDIICAFDMTEHPIGQATIAREYARDFICAAYATGLPINSVAIAINQPNKTIGLDVAVGAAVAKTQPTSTWTDHDIGPTNFIHWVESGPQVDDEFHPERDLNVSGPWAN